MKQNNEKNQNLKQTPPFSRGSAFFRSPIVQAMSPKRVFTSAPRRLFPPVSASPLAPHLVAILSRKERALDDNGNIIVKKVIQSPNILAASFIELKRNAGFDEECNDNQVTLEKLEEDVVSINLNSVDARALICWNGSSLGDSPHRTFTKPKQTKQAQKMIGWYSSESERSGCTMPTISFTPLELEHCIFKLILFQDNFYHLFVIIAPFKKAFREEKKRLSLPHKSLNAESFISNAEVSTSLMVIKEVHKKGETVDEKKQSATSFTSGLSSRLSGKALLLSSLLFISLSTFLYIYILKRVKKS